MGEGAWRRSSPTGSWTSRPSVTGVERSELGRLRARNRAVGARLQQVTQPGDRVAILCPQNLGYLVAFFGTLLRPDRRAAVRSERARPRRPPARRPRRLPPSAILTTTEAAEGVRKFFRRRPARSVRASSPSTRCRTRSAPPGSRRHRSRHHRLPAVHLGFDPHPDRRADHPPEPGHQRGAGDRGPAGRGRRPWRVLAAVLPRHGPDHGAMRR